jgi:hypothetical protein
MRRMSCVLSVGWLGRTPPRCPLFERREVSRLLVVGPRLKRAQVIVDAVSVWQVGRRTLLVLRATQLSYPRQTHPFHPRASLNLAVAPLSPTGPSSQVVRPPPPPSSTLVKSNPLRTPGTSTSPPVNPSPSRSSIPLECESLCRRGAGRRDADPCRLTMGGGRFQHVVLGSGYDS